MMMMNAKTAPEFAPVALSVTHRNWERSSPLGTDWKFPEDRPDYHPMPPSEPVLLPNVLAAIRPPELLARALAGKRHRRLRQLSTQPQLEVLFAAATALSNEPIDRAVTNFKANISHETSTMQALGADPQNAERVAACVGRITDHRQRLQDLGCAILMAKSTSQEKINRLMALKSVGLDLSGTVALDESALHLATRSGLDGVELGKVVTLLIAWGVPVRSEDRAGDTVCHRLAHVRHADPMPSLRAVVSAGANLVAPNREGKTPLELILQRHEDGCDMFERLRTFNPSLTSVSPVRQQNLLHTVIAHHDAPHIVDILLRAHVSPIQEDYFGLTPWDQAVILNRTASLQVIQAYALRQPIDIKCVSRRPPSER